MNVSPPHYQCITDLVIAFTVAVTGTSDAAVFDQININCFREQRG